MLEQEELQYLKWKLINKRGLSPEQAEERIKKLEERMEDDRTKKRYAS